MLPPQHVLPAKAARAGFDALGEIDGITWLGHSSFLIRLDGWTLLTDPFLTATAGPLPGWGPKRYAGPALGPDQLPPIDAVLVSHNHYDHLDWRTLRRLPDRKGIVAVVPWGLGASFRQAGFADTRELAWHEETAVGSISVNALPVLHHSGRGLFDHGRSLWCGFGIGGRKHRLFFAGDTGYGEVFAALGTRYRPFHVGLMPIGGYEPRVLFDTVHVTPEEAVAIGRDMKIQTLVGMHWGTIKLTDEPLTEPPSRFLAAGRAAGYADDNLWVMKIGETRALLG